MPRLLWFPTHRSRLGASLSLALLAVVATLPFASHGAGATAPMPPPSAPIVQSPAGTLMVGHTHFVKIKASGFPKPTLTEQGDLPAGVTFTPMNGYALVGGTPTVGSGNDYILSITATNSQGSDTEDYDLTVQQNPVWSPEPASLTESVGQYVHFDNGTPGAYSEGDFLSFLGENNNLPGNLTYVDNNDNTGTLSGVLQPGTGGRYPLRFEADGNGNIAAFQNMTLFVDQPPAFSTESSAVVTVGQNLSASPLSDGGDTGYPRAMNLTMNGALPTGVFVQNRPGRKKFEELFRGKPKPGSAGDYLLNISADNGAGGPVQQGYVLIVRDPTVVPQTTALTLSPNATTTYENSTTFTATVSGGTSPTGYVQFSLPDSNAPVTVPVVGGTASFTTPTSLDAGDYTLTASYTGDAENAAASATADLHVDPAPTTLSVSGPTSTLFGVPATFTATVTSPQGVPSGSVEFILNGQATDVDVDSSGVATFQTDPTLTGSGGPYEVDATFNSYSDAPGDWAQSTTAPAEYTIGPVNLAAVVGDGNSADSPVTVNDGDTVTVDPTQNLQISGVLTAALGTDVPPGPLDIALTQGTIDVTSQVVGSGSEEDSRMPDPQTGSTDFFWDVPAGTLSGLSGTSAVVTLSFAGTDEFSSDTISFTLNW